MNYRIVLQAPTGIVIVLIKDAPDGIELDLRKGSTFSVGGASFQTTAVLAVIPETEYAGASVHTGAKS